MHKKENENNNLLKFKNRKTLHIYVPLVKLPTFVIETKFAKYCVHF